MCQTDHEVVSVSWQKTVTLRRAFNLRLVLKLRKACTFVLSFGPLQKLSLSAQKQRWGWQLTVPQALRLKANDEVLKRTRSPMRCHTQLTLNLLPPPHTPCFVFLNLYFFHSRSSLSPTMTDTRNIHFSFDISACTVNLPCGIRSFATSSVTAVSTLPPKHL